MDSVRCSCRELIMPAMSHSFSKWGLGALFLFVALCLASCQSPAPALAWNVDIEQNILSVERSIDDSLTATVIVKDSFSGTDFFSVGHYSSEFERRLLYPQHRQIDFSIVPGARYLVQVIDDLGEQRFSVLSGEPLGDSSVSVVNWPSVLDTETVTVEVSNDYDGYFDVFILIGLLSLWSVAVVAAYKFTRGS